MIEFASSGGDASLLCDMNMSNLIFFSKSCEQICATGNRTCLQKLKTNSSVPWRKPRIIAVISAGSLSNMLGRTACDPSWPATTREGATDEHSHIWGGSNEEPHKTRRELLRRTVVHIISSPHPAQ
ncbi:hypothetical protein EDD17DRAFT_1600037, partial [Pisolithus thermaeus]